MTQDIPEPWASAMDEVGISSLRQLGIKSGVATETVRRLVHGVGTTSDPVLRKVARALGGRLPEVSAWAQLPRPIGRQFVPPPEADRLDDDQRDLVTRLIRALAQVEQEQEPRVKLRVARKSTPERKHRLAQDE